MAKKDFSILLEPSVESTLNAKDIAFVTDVYSIGQQIKNIILGLYGERPFTPNIGLNFELSKLQYSESFYIMQYRNKIKNKIEYLIKDIKNVSINTSVNGSQLLIEIKFDYKTKTQQKSGNLITITVNTL